jgi:hypothetical protein
MEVRTVRISRNANEGGYPNRIGELMKVCSYDRPLPRKAGNLSEPAARSRSILTAMIWSWCSLLCKT